MPAVAGRPGGRAPASACGLPFGWRGHHRCATPASAARCSTASKSWRKDSWVRLAPMSIRGAGVGHGGGGKTGDYPRRAPAIRAPGRPPRAGVPRRHPVHRQFIGRARAQRRPPRSPAPASESVMRSVLDGTLGLLLALARPKCRRDGCRAAGAHAACAWRSRTPALTPGRRGACRHRRRGATPRHGGADRRRYASGSSPPFANSYRAYPPSCLADPSPFDTPTEAPRYARPCAWPPSVHRTATRRRDVTITLWRVPCSSSASPVLQLGPCLAIDRGQPARPAPTP